MSDSTDLIAPLSCKLYLSAIHDSGYQQYAAWSPSANTSPFSRSLTVAANLYVLVAKSLSFCVTRHSGLSRFPAEGSKTPSARSVSFRFNGRSCAGEPAVTGQPDERTDINLIHRCNRKPDELLNAVERYFREKAITASVNDQTTGTPVPDDPN